MTLRLAVAASFASFASFALTGCKVDSGGVPAESEAEAEAESEGEGEAKAGCPILDPTQIEACCAVEGASAHCAPIGAYPKGSTDSFASCGDDGVCVPDEILQGGEGYLAKSCTSVLDSPGACLSLCLPEVAAAAAEYGDLIPQDTCRDDQRCIPCVDPTTGASTGVCDPLSCEEGSEGESESEAEEYTCENPPPGAVADPSAFEPCCEGASCVPGSLVPPEESAALSECDAGEESGWCIPDLFIETGGIFTLPTCVSIGGLEGRCISMCLPDVGAQSETLPQATCAATERCAPCCDPLSGDETGLCSLACDVGPEASCAEKAFDLCCDDSSGHCIPTELIPDDGEEGLRSSGDTWACPEATLCVPDVLQEPDFAGEPCTEPGIFGFGAYMGVCLPSCLEFGIGGLLLGQADCPAEWTCVPCNDPLTGDPTGAPGCAE
ncbi:MAG: hypothetical protein AABZ30_05640 [Myxococcota bacterium]